MDRFRRDQPYGAKLTGDRFDIVNANMNRREFLKTTSAGSMAAGPFQRLAAALQKKIKITDVKCMIVRGTWDWNLIKVETDSGLYGIGEAYWGWGVKDLVLNKMKPIVVGEGPAQRRQAVYEDAVAERRRGRHRGRDGHSGKRHRDRTVGSVRPYSADAGLQPAGRPFPRSHPILSDATGGGKCGGSGGVAGPRRRKLARRNGSGPASNSRAMAFRWKADPDFKEPGHDPYARGLTNKDYRRIVHGMETVRETLGPDTDFAVECHWRYDTQDVIRLARELEPVKPMWLEDPVPPDNIEAMQRVTQSIAIPVCTGENLYGRQGFRKLIEMQACSGVHIDVPKSGGLSESKKISDLADLYYIWTACHNPASPVGTIASCHAASAMREFRIHELAKWVDWWPDLVIREGPFWGERLLHDSG